MKKWPGIYSGIVVENDDPKGLGRIRVEIDGLGQLAQTPWALPCFPGPGLKDEGFCWVPNIGANIWVMFQAGDFDHPVYLGGFFASPTKTGAFAQETGNEMPGSAQESPTRIRQLKTRSGHTIIFDDREESAKIEIQDAAGQVIRMTCNMPEETKRDAAGKKLKENSDITPDDVDEAKIEVIDVHGNTLELTEDGVHVLDVNENDVAMTEDGVAVEDTNGNKVTADSNGIEIEDKNGNKITKTSSGITVTDVNGNEVEMAAAGVTLKTGDATIWMPNILPNCLFTGAPHGGSGAGIVKLKGG